MSDPSLAFQGWINTTLRGGNVGVSTRVHDRVPPSAAKPYISFGPAQALKGPGDGECFATFDCVQSIDVWSETPGHAETKQIAGACRALLHGKMPVLVGYKVLDPTVVSTRYLPDSDGLMTHAVIDIRALIGEAEIVDATEIVWSIAGESAIGEGAGEQTFTVSYEGGPLSPGQTATILVVSASGGKDALPGASKGDDFSSVFSTLTFTGGGATAQTVAVEIVDDTVAEGTEDFIVGIDGASVGTLGDSRAVTIILDADDEKLNWNVDGPSEIDEFETEAVYTVSYTGPAIQPDRTATITIGTTGASGGFPNATGDADYTSLTTVLTFTGGEVTQQTVAVLIIDDGAAEGTEDFSVTISGPSFGSVSTSQVFTDIVDDDEASPESGGGLPLDDVSGAVQAYSMRLLRSAYEGPCLRLRRTSDNAESDIGFDEFGAIDLGAIFDFTGGASCRVVTWYDQSGGGHDASQSNVSLQPTFVILSTPVIDFPANRWLTMSRPTPASSWSAFAVLSKDSGTDGMVLTDNVQNRQHRINFEGGANVMMYAGEVLAPSYLGSVTAMHLYAWQNNGDNSGEIRVDASSLGTGDPGTGTLGCDHIGFLPDGGDTFDGKMGEIIVFDPVLSDPDRSTIESDAMTYWGL